MSPINWRPKKVDIFLHLYVPLYCTMYTLHLSKGSSDYKQIATEDNTPLALFALQCEVHDFDANIKFQTTEIGASDWMVENFYPESFRAIPCFSFST